MGEKKIFAKGPEVWQVGFVSPEKHCSEVFFRWIALRFRDITYANNPQSFGDLLLNEKQKKPFVSLKDQVTITQSFLTAASLAQVDNAPNGADSNLFCRDT